MINYLENNIATSKEIQTHCNLTARKVSWQIKKLGRRIIKIANGRSPKYALTTNAFGVDDDILIWEVDNFGKTSYIASLRPLAAGGFFVESNIGMPNAFLGEANNGLYDDLPYFLYDMAPKGFLGNRIAKNIADIDERYPRHLSDWKTEHIGRYLLANTDNSIGNLKFGNNANLNLRAATTRHSRNQYLDIADDIIHTDTILSSAGGEQQKFTTYCTDINAHVLVKFSPKGDDANARRWKDILLTEHHAALIINQTKMVTAANTKILEFGGRIFLESERFDRQGENGRRSMLSLSVIDAEFVGSGDNWLKSANNLHKQKLLSRQDLVNVEFLTSFAKLINNTDTHMGNISFETHNQGFSLLPIYDMCSMGFAPRSNGEVLPFKFSCPISKLEDKKKMGLFNQFWNSVANDKYISEEFKVFISTLLKE